MNEHKKHSRIIQRAHPGKVLEYELKKRNLQVHEFAVRINEFPIIIHDILEGRKKISLQLGKLIEKELGLEPGTFFLSNEYYELVQTERAKQGDEPFHFRFRPKLFGDVGYDSINWKFESDAVIHRVFKLGNEKEKKEITRFYGEEYVNIVLTENLLKHTERLVKRPASHKDRKRKNGSK